MVLIFSRTQNLGLDKSCNNVEKELKDHNAKKWDTFTRGVSSETKQLSNLVKVADDLVQQPEAFQALLVDVILVVKLLVVGNGGEHDGDVFVPFAVKRLHKNRSKKKVP